MASVGDLNTKEFDFVLTNVKSRKAAGIGRINMEMIKFTSVNVNQLLLDIFNLCVGIMNGGDANVYQI